MSKTMSWGPRRGQGYRAEARLRLGLSGSDAERKRRPPQLVGPTKKAKNGGVPTKVKLNRV